MGSGKKQTIGYKYYLGMHLILCHGPVDKIRDIKVDGRVAWEGDYAGGRININADNLFGGTKREGGVSGAVDFEPGHSTQARNDYLQSQLGSAIPAFRGVAGLVLRQCYLGINPYLKRWSARLQRIHVRQDGVAQWYDAKAQIGSLWKTPQAIYVALDLSGSMDELVAPGMSRLDSAKISLVSALNYIDEIRITSSVRVDVMIVGWGNDPNVRQSLTKRNCTSANIAELVSWVNSRTAVYGTYFPAAVSDAPLFFSDSPSEARRTSIFLTDGEPTIPTVPGSANSPEAIASATAAGETLLSISGINAYAFVVDLEDTSQAVKLDNRQGGSVPVLNGTNPDELRNAITSSLGGQLDMNPAHIIRECLTDLTWGMGYQEADVDVASFTAAANRLYSEAMGISILWDRQIPIEDFVSEIIRHINAALYVDRITGKFILKLIRDDFSEGDLITLGENEIDRVDGYSRPAFGEMVNSITVNFWDARTGKTSSVTAQDTALIQLQGSVIGTTLQYPGFTNHRIATQVAMRNLQAMSFPLLSCTIYANRVAASLNIGDVFRFEWPDYHEGYIVMRVTGMALGDGRKNAVRITCMQDVFSLPEVASVSEPDDVWSDPSAVPTPAVYRIVTEAPYYELVQRLGQAQADEQLAANPDAGLILASAGRPAGAINATLMVDAGSGYEDSGVVEFSPFAFLASAIGPVDTVVPISGGDGLSEITIGSHAQIDNELVRIDGVTDTAITVGRGVLDTVPAAHAEGALVIAWDDFAEGDQVEYAFGEVVNVKLLPVSGAGSVSLADATAGSVTFAKRAVRPYPPGAFKINGQAYPSEIVPSINTVLTWAHRDRIQQTSGALVDTTAGNVGPESGTTYTVQIRNIMADALLGEQTGISGTSATFNTSAYSASALKFLLWSVRGGVASYQRHEHIALLDTDWTPAVVNTALWFDAADASTITLTSGAVSAWADKSGNGYNVSQGAASARPAVSAASLNGLNTLTFDGGDWLARSTATDLARNVSRVIFGAVVKHNAVPTTVRQIVSCTNNAGTGNRLGLETGRTSGKAAIGGRRLDGDSFQSRVFSANVSTAYQIHVGVIDYSAAQALMALDGTPEAAATFQTAGLTSDTTSAALRVSGNGTAEFISGAIAEIVLIHNDSSSTTREKLEGYLAHKWGLTGSLPSGHPYKTTPPTT